ncbi:trehalose-phosphatase [Aquabacter spiritensis]|uniref:Trehalose 6-phosphate phosphatase n=1 Tax=Aquabacter spiritensis TaxID=933073 RepID=A0A4R3LTT3_9HYPH|nr:trehalose-phosphatase [Aquabacter spiritensis]TCT03914.1 trehalose 6-phosphatase [Aquabacter spiritensis]
MTHPVPPALREFGAATGAGATALLDTPIHEVEALLDPSTNAFFFDVDGTLIDIAPHPDAVEVPASLIRDLTALSEVANGAIALVSGRAADVLDRLFAPMSLALSGIHGAQMRRVPGAALEQPGAPLDPAVRADLSGVGDAHSGVLVEDKGASVALHYRNDPALGPRLEEEIARIVARDPRGLTVLPGRMVFEVKRRGYDKGAAVRAFMDAPPFAGRIPVFLGDDVTDEAGFAAVREMHGIAISVGRRLPGADVTLPHAQDVRALVKRLARSAERRV